MSGVVFDKIFWDVRDEDTPLHRLASECGLEVCTPDVKDEAVAALANGPWTFLLVHVDEEQWESLVDALAPEKNAVWVSNKTTEPRPGTKGAIGGYGFECYRRREYLTTADVRALIATFSDPAAVARLRYEGIVPRDLRGVLRLTAVERIRELARLLRSFLEDAADVPRSEAERLADVCQVLPSGMYPVATICREMGYGPDDRDALGIEACELLLLLEWFQGDRSAGTARIPPPIELVKAASRQIHRIWNELEAI